MSKRIYYKENERIFQHKPKGQFYCYVGGNEFPLDTNDPAEALNRLKYVDQTSTFFGPAAFNHKLSELFPMYLDHKKKSVRASTFKEYEKLWKIFEATGLGKLRLVELNQTTWDKFCNSKKHSITDFQNPRNLVHNFLTWCQRRRFIGAVVSLENPVHKRRKRRIIPNEHLALIFQYADGSLLLFLSMALYMGMRRSEIIKLSWSRVNLVERHLILRDEDVKTGEGREIPLNNVVHGLLCKRLVEQEGVTTKWVFPNGNDPKRHADPTGLKTAWWNVLRKAGLYEKDEDGHITWLYSFHDFRATYELYSNLSKDFTDTQKEKMVGAQIDVQKRIYVSMKAKHLLGLEEVVATQVPELQRIIENKTVSLKPGTGIALESRIETDLKKEKKTNKDGVL